MHIVTHIECASVFIFIQLKKNTARNPVLIWLYFHGRIEMLKKHSQNDSTGGKADFSKHMPC